MGTLANSEDLDEMPQITSHSMISSVFVFFPSEII